MRLFPILAAIVAMAVIYAFVFERERFVAAPSGPEIDAAQPAQNTESTADAAYDHAVRVIAMHSVARDVDTAVIARGNTEADRQVELRAETSGQVISAPLRKGTFVEQDQQLCTLDSGTRASVLIEAQSRLIEAKARVPEAQAKVPESEARVSEAQARVQEAKSQLAEAMINYNAAVKLEEGGYASETRVAATKASMRGAEAGVVSAEAGLKAAASGLESVAAGIEAARAGISSAEAAVAATENDIANLTITAPFAGLLESDTAELGSLLQPGSLCATVIQLDPIILVGFIPETEVGRVNMGARAGAQLASGQTVQGNVIFISRSADPETRTFRVEIEVSNPDLSLRDGQTAEILISADGTTAHLLPQSALTLNDEGIMGVRIVAADKTAKFVPVTLLRDTSTGVWLSGLPDQADVIVIGQEFVIDGVPVIPTFQEIGQ